MSNLSLYESWHHQLSYFFVFRHGIELPQSEEAFSKQCFESGLLPEMTAQRIAEKYDFPRIDGRVA